MDLQIARWADDGAVRKCLPPGLVGDIDLYARIFQNDLHNVSIAEELRRREAKRRITIQERSTRQTAVIIADALGQPPQMRSDEAA